jgi:hypothetical protein
LLARRAHARAPRELPGSGSNHLATHALDREEPSVPYIPPVEESGARVFDCIPKSGYVGVGTVRETAQPIREFKVDLDGSEVPLLDAPLENANIGGGADDRATAKGSS